MVPEEIDQLGEKFDSLDRGAKRAPPLYEAQNDIEHDARNTAPQHRFCLDRHGHDAGSCNPGNQGRPGSRVERAGAHQVVGDQRGKGSGRDITQGLGNAGRQRSPAQGKRRPMRKNAIAAHDDSHRTKNSLTGIAGTSSVKYSITRQRNGNADHDACRHGNIREAQELAYGDGHRARNRRDNVAARQPLRKE